MDEILFVAVSDAMKLKTEPILKRMGISMQVIVGSQSDAQRIAERFPNTNVFISRGATGSQLHDITGKSVVHILTAISDFLAPIHALTAQGCTKIGFCNSTAMFGHLHHDYKVGDVQVILEAYEQGGLESTVEKFKSQEVQVIVTGTNNFPVVEQFGLTPYPFESSDDAIERAIEEAIRTHALLETQKKRETKRFEEINARSQSLYSSIETAFAAIEELSASSEELAEISRSSSKIVETAYRDIDKISDVLKIIKYISSQINLLGLNAAIEAARAGEEGRGFMVVASEVRKLADESSKSAENIKKLLAEFNATIKTVMTNVNQNNEIVQEQAKANQHLTVMMEQVNQTGYELIDILKGDILPE